MPADGPLPESRISNASQARQVYDNFFNADRRSAYNRTLVSALIGGTPPYSITESLREGNAARTNLNFLDTYGQICSAQSRYQDLIESPDVLARPRLPDELPDATGMEDIAAFELDRLYRRSWKDFYPRFNSLTREFVTNGVSVGYFPDDKDWRWDFGGLDDFLFPRDVRPSEEEMETVIGIRKMPVHKLYNYIRDETYAEGAGWNVKAVKKEIVAATTGEKNRTDYLGEWAAIQARYKNNDLGESQATSTTVTLLHFWVQEFSGKISHYIISRDWSEDPEFLYVKRDKFESADRAFSLFTNGAGVNDSIHSIRGLGFILYGAGQELNRVRCAMVDNAKMSGLMVLNTSEQANQDDPPLVINGNFAQMAPGVAVAQSAFEDRSQSLSNIARELTMLSEVNSGQYRPRAVNPTNSDTTKYELQSQTMLEAALGDAEVSLFYRGWQKLMAESFRRIIAIGPDNGSYPEVKEFFKRCARRGVPYEVLKEYTDFEVVRAIGNGSPAQRLIAFDRSMPLVGSMDEIGRNNFQRDYLSAVFRDRRASDRYLPKPEETRPVIDEKMALMENNDMHGGFPAERLVGENDQIHAEIHLQDILQVETQLEQLRMSGQPVDLQATLPQLQFLELAIPHASEHVEAIKDDMFRKQAYGALRQAVANAYQKFMTFVRQVRQIAGEQQQTGPDVPDEVRAEEKKIQLKLREMQLTAQQKMQASAAEIQQKLAGRQAEMDQELAHEIRMNNVKASRQPKTIQ